MAVTAETLPQLQDFLSASTGGRGVRVDAYTQQLR
jgi:hypothetical protein